MQNGIEQQKKEKKKSLLDAAYELFLSKGFHKTSIDDIVKRANVAKGTFYLYFKDKSDVMEDIAVRLSYRVLQDAYAHMMAHDTGDFVENIVSIVDYIVEYFKKNKLVLGLVHRDFSWPLLHKTLDDPDYGNADALLQVCYAHPYMAERTHEEIFQMIFMIVELCGSICYTSIMNNLPAPIDELKPTLYGAVRRILAPGTAPQQ